MNTIKLSPSERLILNSIRSSMTPVHAGTILSETGCSISTLGNAMTRLRQVGLIEKVDMGDGPRFVVALKAEAI